MFPNNECFIRNNDELRRDAADALCCLAYALGEDFTKYIRMIDKLLSKHHLRVSVCSLHYFNKDFEFDYFNHCLLFLQHRDFDEIKRRLKRREPPILDSLSVQKLSQNVPAEVISDPLNDIESDPYEEGNELHRQPRNHQVLFTFSS